MRLTAPFALGAILCATRVYAATFAVPPSGSDDTAALEAAFADAKAHKAAHPHEEVTVQLGAGRYYSTDIIVEDYSGALRGAGRGTTFIDTLRSRHLPGQDSAAWQENPTVPGVEAQAIYDYGDAAGFAALFTFRGGDITISDMTFDPTALLPAEPYLHAWWLSYEQGLQLVWISGSHTSSLIEDVDFHANEGTVAWYGDPLLATGSNVVWSVVVLNRFVNIPDYFPEPGWSFDDAFFYAELMYGSHTVRNCSFENAFLGVAMSGLADGVARIADNRFHNLWYGVGVDSATRYRYDISRNDITDVISAGVLARQSLWIRPAGPVPPFDGSLDFAWGEAATYAISGNHIRALSGSSAMEGQDDKLGQTGQKGMDLAIRNNAIELDARPGRLGELFGAYFGVGFAGLRGGQIANNSFTGGASFYGIVLFGAQGSMIVNNDLEGLDADVTPIFLNRRTRQCKVVGGSTSPGVRDLGTDNILIGVTPL